VSKIYSPLNIYDHYKTKLGTNKDTLRTRLGCQRSLWAISYKPDHHETNRFFRKYLQNPFG